MKHIIKLIGGEFVKDFSNTLFMAVPTTDKGAKRFDSKEEAEKWGKAYLTAYHWEIQVVPN